MSKTSRFFENLTRLDKSAFSLSTGVRAATFVVAPMLIGLASKDRAFIFATLGALWMTNTEGQLSVSHRRVLFVACFTESAFFGLGTLAATTGLLSPLLLAIAVSVALLARGSPTWATTGTFTAIAFAIGTGLPGASLEQALVRSSFSLGGAFLALLGVELHQLVLRGTHHISQMKTAPDLAISQRGAIRSAVLLGIVSALGFAFGLALALPRDFWVVVTIITSVRPRLSLTVSFTSMMSVGTIIGAIIAAAITLQTNNVYVLLLLLFAFAVLMFALRGVNSGLVQVFLTPFIIILINILYPGEWYLAFYRILEVLIGVTLAIVAVYLLTIKKKAS